MYFEESERKKNQKIVIRGMCKDCVFWDLLELEHNPNFRGCLKYQDENGFFTMASRSDDSCKSFKKKISKKSDED